MNQSKESIIVVILGQRLFYSHVLSSSKAIPLRCQSGDPSLFPQCHFHKVASYQGLFACALLSLERSIETTGIQVLLFLFFTDPHSFRRLQFIIGQTFPDKQKREFAANSNRALDFDKGGLISEYFSLWIHLPKKCAKSLS